MTYAISAEIPSPRSSPRFSLHSLRQQMDFVAEHLLEELALGRPHRIHVGLNVEVHGRAGVLVTQDPSYRLRVYFHLRDLEPSPYISSPYMDQFKELPNWSIAAGEVSARCLSSVRAARVRRTV